VTEKRMLLVGSAVAPDARTRRNFFSFSLIAVHAMLKFPDSPSISLSLSFCIICFLNSVILFYF